MTLLEVLEFVRSQRLAVQASTSESGAPQAAVIGIATSERFEIVFDTLASTRKCQNLRKDPRVALVIGWDLAEERTVQLEGVADEPSGDELARLKAVYFGIYPDGVARQAWPQITYFRVRPSWLRYSDFRTASAALVEFDERALRSLPGALAPGA